MNTSIYQNIATRTAGDIYIGVVGPVRTGKSTFIKRFMETQIIPNIDNVYRRERARDELPQSGSGRTVMTAEPKFVPEEAAQIQLEGGAAFSVRLIDCVGYMVRGALGQTEDDQPRMVTTPWYDHPIPMTEAGDIASRYQVKCVPVNCLRLEEEDVGEILKAVLYEFPMRELDIFLPPWVDALPGEHPVKAGIYDAIRQSMAELHHIREIDGAVKKLGENENISEALITAIDLGTGVAAARVSLPREMFYRTLSEQSGFDVGDDGDLMSLLTKLAGVKTEYDKVAGALRDVRETGYGIVVPGIDELKLEEPEIMKQGGRYGVRLKASAPSIHMIRADIETAVSPIVGNEKQSEDMVNYLLQEFEGDTSKIWQSNIFGRSFHEVVSDDLQTKLKRMPEDARKKLQETLTRIINEGSGGLICIIL